MAHNEFGKFLARVRRKRNKTQKEVGLAIGKSTAYVCDIERGRRGAPGPWTLMQISDYLNIPSTELYVKAGIIDKGIESRYGQYFKILRSKMRAQRVGKVIEGAKNDVEALKTETNGVGGEVSQLVISLQNRILELETVLTFGCVMLAKLV
jgi:transcriptional regulator with XRE-family HTH domain